MNYGQQQKSILETYIERACDATRYEPDLGLNLEICDVIKEKQKNTPREAAIYIVRLINNRNLHVGMLALSLLDICVKNCGHPFHLQIATKEFLNELVRKFPERPLPMPTQVQSRILELIQEWYMTLCKTSRYRDDLVHIKDMHRLLTYKGYRFPRVRDDNTSVLNPVATLKSPTELEEEDRVAQSAKLQELIRRGRPEDVLAANELVKKMTGYDQEDKPDYKEQASSEVDKILQKAVLLNEMLNDVKPHEIIGRNDIFADMLSTCKAAQPKIQKFISEGGEDMDNMEELLQVNDVINQVIEQYAQVKSGNLVKVTLSLPALGEADGESGESAAVGSSSSAQPVSLIDLMDDDNSTETNVPAAVEPKTTGNLMDDLMSLNFNDGPAPVWGNAGSISLGGQSPFATGSQSSRSSTPNTSNQGVGYNMFSSPVTSVNPISVASGLNNSNSRTSSPSLNFSGSTMHQPTPTPAAVPAPASSNGFGGDEFDFVSNTGQPATVTAKLMEKNGFKIELVSQYGPDRVTLQAQAQFSNSSSSPLTALTFRVAVPKSLTLKLEPQSAQVVPAFSNRSVTQAMTIANPSRIQPLRMRYHVSYMTGGQTIEEQGEFNDFPAI